MELLNEAVFLNILRAQPGFLGVGATKISSVFTGNKNESSHRASSVMLFDAICLVAKV